MTRAAAEKPPDPASPPSALPSAETEAARSKDLFARFFAIPKGQVSMFASRGASGRPLRFEKDITQVRILPVNALALDVQPAGPGELQIRRSSSSKVSAPLEVAKFKYDKRELTFEWSKGVKLDPETASEVVDAVLEIECAGDNVQYVVLRDPGAPKEHGAISLVEDKTPPTRRRRQGPDEYGFFDDSEKQPKTRKWSADWADKDSLESTKLTFLIRRWHIALTPRGERDPLVIKSAADAEPAARDERTIIPNELSLVVEIGEKDPWKIRVRTELNPSATRNRAARSRRMDDLGREHFRATDLYPPNRDQRIQTLLESLQDQLKELERQVPQDAIGKKVVLQIKEEMEDLKRSREIARTYRLLGEPEQGDSAPGLERADLSLIVCLKLKNGKMLDVARFGDFATPEHRSGPE
jgi:hypothetical protein